VLWVPATHAQTPVAPTIPQSEIEIRRGADIVQPATVFYKRVLPGQALEDVADQPLGVLRIPRPSDLDAIQYTDRSRGFAVNLQHAMIVADGQLVDVQISDRAARGAASASSVEHELLIIRPPDDDAFDVTVPDGLECARLTPGSADDQQSRGRLFDDRPCKQVQGVETVVDVAAWYDVSLTNSLSGIRTVAGSAHNARELRGWLRSLAPGGEQIRFVIVATPPAIERPTVVTVRRDTTVFDPALATVDGQFRINRVSVSGFEWITTAAALGGPNRSDLPGRTAPRYKATRLKGDISSTIRWNATPDQRYELSLFGSTQPTLSSQAVGDHHDVPYGASVAARFGAPNKVGVELRLEGSYEDDPFQRNTLASGDQRVRFLLGLDRGSLITGRTHWRLSTGPTYFVDRNGIWETRGTARQLGYTVDGVLSRVVHTRIPTLLSVGGVVNQSWGYVQDAGNTNLSVAGRLSAKPRLNIGGTMVALGPVVYLSHTESDYADFPGFTENNAQFGVELMTWVTF
jgi:hypothetical protein